MKRAKTPQKARAEQQPSASKGTAGSSKGKKQKQGSAGGVWKAVDVGDDFLLGAEEGGFAGLEVFENCTLIDGELTGMDDGTLDAGTPEQPTTNTKANKRAAEPTPTAEQPAQPKKQKPGKGGAVGGNGGTPAAAGAADDDVGSLKAQLAALQRENQALKAASGGDAAAGAGGGGGGPAAAAVGQAAAGGEGAEGGEGGEVLTGAARRKRKLEAYKAKMTAHRQQAREKKKQQKKQQKQPAGGEGAPGQDAAGGEPSEELLAKREKRRERKQQLKLQKQQQKQAAALAGAGAAEALAGSVGAGKPGRAAKGGAGGQEEEEEAEDEEESGEGAGDEEEEAGVPQVDVSAWRLFSLHPLLEKALALQGFSSPTEVQASVLPAALRDRMDVIGAAQTGSGKTLAFGLPIMQTLLQEQEAASAEGVPPPHAGKLRALIMAPTRELALQVEDHLAAIGKVAGIRVAAIVGGLAHVKQERVLRASPSIVVATPGRLWELLRDKTSPHLMDLSGLSFLVLDEADRMVAKGHFQELSSILGLIPRPGSGPSTTFDADFQDTLNAANELEAKEGAKSGRRRRQGIVEEEEEEEEAAHEDGEEKEGGAGEEQGGRDGDLDGEEEVAAGRAGNQRVDGGAGRGTQRGGGSGGVPAGSQAGQGRKGGDGRRRGGSGGAGGGQPMLQTMVFSATLTLPAALRKRLKKGGGGALGGTDLDSLMDRVPFRGFPRIVDLSSARRLAVGVSESVINCLSGTDRDAVLYYLLARHPGRALVFVNAVSALRRVAAILKLLGLPALSLHAQQQQRQRLRALDSFKSRDNAVLVATDVAARGLDVKDVRIVIHYQLPASVDTYIHRSGRTARGSGAEGLSVALVAPDEAARWNLLVKAMGHEQTPPAFPVDSTLMPQAVERLKLALRIDEEERTARKKAADVGWSRRAAEEAGLVGGGVGSDESDGGDEEDDKALTRARGNKRKAAELSALKQQLAALLVHPLAPHMSRSYFTGGAVAGVALSSAADRGGEAIAGAGKGARAGAGKAAEAGARQSTGTEAGAGAAAAISQAVAMAGRMVGRTAAAASGAGKAGPGGVAGVKKPTKQKRLSVDQLARQELARRSAVKAARKRPGGGAAGASAAGAAAAAGVAGGRGGSRHGRLVVIPPAFSRDTQGPDALAALKRKLQALG